MTRNALFQLDHKHCQNPALLLSHYAKGISADNGSKPKAVAQLVQAVETAGKDPGLAELYKLAFGRWNRQSHSGEGAVVMELSTARRLRIGAGTDNALEWSLRLHPLYGTPLIPGSAIKGVASHYFHNVWGAVNPEFRSGGDFHNFMFGSTDSDGALIFHDAWITPDSLAAGGFRRDVMTPHHLDWQDKKTAPTDFDSPTPVACMSVCGTFRIALSWKRTAELEDGSSGEVRKHWLQLVADLVKESLEKWGIGGKTSSGYGRLTAPDRANLPTDEPAEMRGRGQLAAPPKASPPLKDHIVKAVLVEEKTKSGGWKARHGDSIGEIQNSKDVPGDAKPGDELELLVAISNAQRIAFTFPTEKAKADAAKRLSQRTAPRPQQPRNRTY